MTYPAWVPVYLLESGHNACYGILGWLDESYMFSNGAWCHSINGNYNCYSPSWVTFLLSLSGWVSQFSFIFFSYSNIPRWFLRKKKTNQTSIDRVLTLKMIQFLFCLISWLAALVCGRLFFWRGHLAITVVIYTWHFPVLSLVFLCPKEF